MLQFKLKLFAFKLNNNSICDIVNDLDLPHVTVLDDLDIFLLLPQFIMILEI